MIGRGTGLLATGNRGLLVGGAFALFAVSLVLALLISPLPEAGAGGSALKASAVKSAAKKKAVAKCRKIRAGAKRKACLSQVNQRFLSPKVVDVRDDYFFPEALTVRLGRRVTWDWGTTNGNSHNVMLDPLSRQPKGLTRADFFRLDSGRSPAVNFRFTRELPKTGTYNFYCSLHSTVMRMKVNVKR